MKRNPNNHKNTSNHGSEKENKDNERLINHNHSLNIHSDIDDLNHTISNSNDDEMEIIHHLSSPYKVQQSVQTHPINSSSSETSPWNVIMSQKLNRPFFYHTIFRIGQFEVPDELKDRYGTFSPTYADVAVDTSDLPCERESHLDTANYGNLSFQTAGRNHSLVIQTNNESLGAVTPTTGGRYVTLVGSSRSSGQKSSSMLTRSKTTMETDSVTSDSDSIVLDIRRSTRIVPPQKLVHSKSNVEENITHNKSIGNEYDGHSFRMSAGRQSYQDEETQLDITGSPYGHEIYETDQLIDHLSHNNNNSNNSSNNDNDDFESTQMIMWSCKVCTLLNVFTHSKCAVCDAPRDKVLHRYYIMIYLTF